jgi:hypothetical protein
VGFPRESRISRACMSTMPVSMNVLVGLKTTNYEEGDYK